MVWKVDKINLVWH